MNKKIYTLIAVIAVLVSAVTAVFAETDNSENGLSALPTSLGNGSFENTVISENDFGTGANSGGSTTGSGKWCLEPSSVFEKWTNWKNLDDKRFYWETTAKQGYVELGVDDSLYTNRTWSYIDGYNFLAREGTQFAELVSNEKASLYQNISSTPGDILSWGLSHRARVKKHPKDIMALFIGPMQKYSYTKATADGNDIFIWMAKVIEDAGYFDSSDKGTDGVAVHECSDAFTIYSNPNIDISSVNSNNYKEYFSLTKTAEITEEWHCWIISDTRESWGDHVGTYEVPSGQTATTFAFTALTGSYNNETYPNEGNLLDAIKFTYAFPLTVATTGGGNGTVSADDKDADGNSVENVKVMNSENYTGNYLSGTNITITATAEENNKFLGAYVNDEFHEAGKSEYFTVNNGVYTMSLTIDSAQYVQLIFSKEATVIYDPNGGTYDGSKENTEIKMAAMTSGNDYAEWKNSTDAVSSNVDKIRFIGWYFARANSLIKSDHTIKYNKADTGDTLSVSYTDTDGDTGTKTVDANTGLTFVAQWEYLQETVAMTKQTGEATYKESTVGGTVSMQITENNDTKSAEKTSDFARLNDTVNLTATVKDENNYVFMGWYDEDGNILSHSNTYSYSVTSYKTIYAHFSAKIVYPYLSFISELREPNTEESIFKQGSHVRVGDECVWSDESYNGGNGLYGNTIATGFTLQTNGVTGYSFDRCRWTFTIPVDRTYIKILDDENKSSFLFEVNETPILTDEKVRTNKGAIYKVNGVRENENTSASGDKVTIRVIDKLPTVLTGDSVVMYGMVIDNLYAPSASAVFELTSVDKSTSDYSEYTDITDDGSSIIHAGSLEEYQGNKNNIYK